MAQAWVPQQHARMRMARQATPSMPCICSRVVQHYLTRASVVAPAQGVRHEEG